MKTRLETLGAISLMGLFVWGGIGIYLLYKSAAPPAVGKYREVSIEQFKLSESPARNLVPSSCWKNEENDYSFVSHYDYRLVSTKNEILIPSFVALFVNEKGLYDPCLFDFVDQLSSPTPRDVLYVGIGHYHAAPSISLEGVYRVDLSSKKLTHLTLSSYFSGQDYAKLFPGYEDEIGVVIKDSKLYALDLAQDSASLLYTLAEGESFFQRASYSEEGGYDLFVGPIEYPENALLVNIYSTTLAEDGSRISYGPRDSLQDIKVDSPGWQSGKYVLFKHLKTLELPISFKN
jgi:hypothetical protein